MLYKINILIFAPIKCATLCFTNKLYVISNCASSCHSVALPWLSIAAKQSVWGLVSQYSDGDTTVKKHCPLNEMFN